MNGVAEGRLLRRVMMPFEFVLAVLVGAPLGAVLGIAIGVVIYVGGMLIVFSSAREALRRQITKRLPKKKLGATAAPPKADAGAPQQWTN